MTDTRIKLNNGTEIPLLALGTWKSPVDEVAKAVEYAIVEAGYRHIDTAQMYQNEVGVGRGIKQAIASGKVKREDLFITTKLAVKSHARVAAAVDESLERLGLDYIDLFLMHWPCGLNPNNDSHPTIPTLPDGTRDHDPNFSIEGTWKQFEAVYGDGKGKLRAIGVSNFSVPVLEDLLKVAKVVPAVDQIEGHPLCPQLEIYEFAKTKNIVIESYSAFGSDGTPLFEHPVVQEVAKKNNVTPGTVLLSYHTTAGRVTLPKSTKPHRILENSKVITLSKEDVAKLDQIHKDEGIKRQTRPPWKFDFKFPDWYYSDVK